MMPFMEKRPNASDSQRNPKKPSRRSARTMNRRTTIPMSVFTWGMRVVKRTNALPYWYAVKGTDVDSRPIRIKDPSHP